MLALSSDVFFFFVFLKPFFFLSLDLSAYVFFLSLDLSAYCVLSFFRPFFLVFFVLSLGLSSYLFLPCFVYAFSAMCSISFFRLHTWPPHPRPFKPSTYLPDRRWPLTRRSASGQSLVVWDTRTTVLSRSYERSKRHRYERSKKLLGTRSCRMSTNFTT